MGDPGQLGQLFTNAATGFAVTGCNGKVVHANQALGKIVDRAAEELNELNLFDLTHPDDQSKHRKLLTRLLAAEIPGYVIEKRFLRPDGSSVWVRSSVSLAGLGGPAEGHLVHLYEDLSDRKKTEQILERQEQMAAIGRLTSSIAHEINNPLEAVFNLIYLAKHARSLEEASPYLQTAEEELGRATEITTQGLQFHRQSSVASPTNVIDLLQTVLVLFRGRFRDAHVKVELATADAPELLCFAGEVRQVFVNLVGNAVEAMQGGGLLKLRVRPATDWRTGARGVRVTVADTGTGMNEETRKRLYDAFYTTKGASGSGLGLWVTANIVRKHSGSIHARSGDTGTVFTLIFPALGAKGKRAGFEDAA